MKAERLSCAIVRDLLPLYNDGMLEQESADAVEEHLRSCPECAAILKKLNQTLGVEDDSSGPQEMPGVEEMLSVTRRSNLKRGIRRGILLAGAVGAVLIGLFVVIFCPVWKVPGDALQISQVYICENDMEADSEFAETFAGDEPYRFAVRLRKEQYSGAHKAIEREGDTMVIRETYPFYKSWGDRPVVEESVSFAVDQVEEIRKVVYNGAVIWNIEKDGEPEAEVRQK